MTDITTVKLEPITRDRLRAAKVGGESYDELVNRLLDEHGVARRQEAPA